MSTEIPHYIPAAFIIAILFPIFMIARLARNNANDQTQNKPIFIGIILFYLSYLVSVRKLSIHILDIIIRITHCTISVDIFSLFTKYLRLDSSVSVLSSQLDNLIRFSLVRTYVSCLKESIFLF